jgi:hypothetical protein
MVKRSQAKALLNDSIRDVGSEGEEAVYNVYISRALSAVEKEEDRFFSASYFFQYYNFGKRAELNKKKRAHGRIAAAEIPAVTQLFTPPHLARYIVENSLGRLLYECGIRLDLPYLDGIGQEDFKKKSISLESLRILDPAAGTGNLIYTAACLMQRAYIAQGYSQQQIPALLAKNFVGLDIDARAVTLCKTLLYKEFGAEFQIAALTKPSEEILASVKNFKMLYDALYHLSERGSLSVFPAQEETDQTFFEDLPEDIQNYLSIFHTEYDIILVNPPYLAGSDCGDDLLQFVDRYYKAYRTDLFAAFIARSFSWLKKEGYLGVVCPFNWMFTKRFGDLRRLILSQHQIVNLAMLPADDYKEAVVYLSCAVFCKAKKMRKGVYIKVYNGENTNDALMGKFGSHGNRFELFQSRFEHTPDNAVIFWTTERFIRNYRTGCLADVLEIRQGLATGNNRKYLKKLCDVNPSEVCFDAESVSDFDRKGKLFAPYNKGGKFRKWYGNRDYVIRFDKASREELSRQGNRLPSIRYYFRPCITWTLVSSKGHFGARASCNSVFDVGGSCGFPKRDEDYYVILGYLCSAVATAYLNAQNPTINCQVGDLKNMPYIEPPYEIRSHIEELVKENIQIARKDWEQNVPPPPEEAKQSFLRMKSNEEELNKIFIRLYGLEDMLSPEVPERLITLKYK